MIKFEDVGKIYPNGVVALKNVTTTIEQGEFIAVIGLSGAGKSTLIRLINKMHEITSGKLTVDGTAVDETLKGKDLLKFRRGIGMVFQSFNLISRTTVLKNVLAARVAELPFWRALLGIYKKEDKVLALNALNKLGILDKAYSRADELSGGQMQRVALARTLAQDPKIILADEPVASLDPVTATEVMQDFEKINKEFNITVVVNMHHVDLALKYARRVIGIRDGEVIFDGLSSEVDNDLLTKIYGRELTDVDIMGV